MKKIFKFSPVFLLALLALFTLFPKSVGATTIYVPSAYGNCNPYTVTFSTDSSTYYLGDSIMMLGTVQQSDADDCFINNMNMGGATSQMNASNNTIIFVFQTTTPPSSNPYSGGPTYFGQAQGDGSQPLYFRFNMWEMCEVGGSCGNPGGTPTSIGQYTYTIGSTSYCVGSNCGTGGSGSGGYNYPDGSISANPNPVAYPGAISHIHWNAVNVEDCTVTSSVDGLISQEPVGDYDSDIYDPTTFTLHCTGSPMVKGNESRKFVYTGNILKDTKNYILSLIPRVIADNNPGQPEINIPITVTALEPQLTVSLTSDKELTKVGTGVVKLTSHISNLPSGVSCKLDNLTKNSTINTFTSPTPLNGVENTDSGLSDTNDYSLNCTDDNNTETLKTVLGQSGALSSTSVCSNPTPPAPPVGTPSCCIPIGGNSCSSVPITFNTVNPKSGITTAVKRDEGSTPVQVASGNGIINTTISVPYGSKTHRSINKVDNGTGGTVDNEMASLIINAVCTNPSQWNGSVCANPTTIDLTASNTTPNTAQVNVAKTFSATITNQGTAATGKAFYNIFQTATGFNDDFTPIGLSTVAANPNPMSALNGGGATNTATRSFTFTTPGIIYMRACADLNTSMIGGVTEGFENNNCSPNWTPVTVSGGADLVAGTTWPTSAPAGVATTYSSTITNQGSASTGASFYNLFQTATGFDDPTLQLGPINLVDYPTTQMAALTAGQSNTATKSITLSAGNYFMRACADKSSASNTGTITEPGAEGNNCSAWVPLSIPPQDQPDLIAGAPTPTVAVVNVATTFRSLITNQGLAGTGKSFGNLFQVTTNPISGPITDYPTPLSMSALAGNGGSATAVSPAITFTSAGTYYMRACADKTSAASLGVVAESSETNNCSAPWTPITVSSGGLPDLTAGGITPTSVMVDVATTFQATVANIGVASTGGSFYNLIQLSPNNPGESPIVEQRVSMTALSAQSSKNFSVTYTFKTAGIYYGRVCADKSSGGDSNGTVIESNETNNCGVWTKITVSGSDKPDLVAGTPSPTVVVINMPNTFSSVITNQGKVSTGDKVSNLFQVSTSPTGASDVTDYPADVNLPALDGGESGTTISPSITFTKEIPYYMRTCADKTSASDAGIIAELNEGNNCSAWVEIKVQAEGLPVDGGWTDWSCGACSVPCGGGTQSCSRTCTNPVPQNGGAQCVGPTTTEQTCNTQACGGGGTGELMLTLTASPSQIFKGRSSTLTWNSTADTCTSEDFVTGDKPTGSVLVTPMATTTYKIACKNSVAEDTASATVKVINPVIIEN